MSTMQEIKKYTWAQYLRKQELGIPEPAAIAESAASKEAVKRRRKVEDAQERKRLKEELEDWNY